MPQLVGKNMTQAYSLLSQVGIKKILTTSIGSPRRMLDTRDENQWSQIYILQQSIAAGQSFSGDTTKPVIGTKLIMINS